MSIEVELASFANVLGRYRFAYLLTNRDGAAPRVIAVVPILSAGELLVDGVGRRTRENLLVQPRVSLVWPPQSEAEYSLIVDGHAAPEGDLVRIRPDRAVLHRPAPRPGPMVEGGCRSDCLELDVPAGLAGAAPPPDRASEP